MARDSIAPVAHLLAAHPEGIDPKDLQHETVRIVAGCRAVEPLTGRQGDVVLAHPFLLHSASPNTTDRLRIISNTSVMLRDPLRFDRDRGHSPVERSTLDALGVARLDHRPTGDRARVVSDRERRWTAARRGG